MTELGLEALRGLAGLLREKVGLQIRPAGLPSLGIAVRARYEAPAPPPVPVSGYLGLLRSQSGEEELRRLLPLVTVGKTQFFRDARQFRALAAMLPGLLAARRAEGRPVAVWSAGCATGEEPYSIAMAAAEAGAAPGEIELLATDVNPEAVAFAMAGRFPARRLRSIPEGLRRRWLEEEDGGAVVGPRLRGLLSAVRVHNLVSDPCPRPLSGAWDLVFCRNVIIYFDTPTAQQVLGRFLDGLVPGGTLFLGYSESLFRMFQGFELAEVEGAFLYRRPLAERPPSAGTPRYAPGAVVRQGPPGAAPGPAEVSTQELLDGTVALLQAGRFAEARQRLERRAAGAGGAGELAVRLTLANLLGVLKEPEAAAAGYQAALRHAPLSAEAHLLYGVHLYGQGELEGAARELGRALFLDPDAAMAHYYLGRCREAAGDLVGARRAYRNAVDAEARQPAGRSHPFVGHYPDLPEDGAPFARAAAAALGRL